MHFALAVPWALLMADRSPRLRPVDWLDPAQLVELRRDLEGPLRAELERLIAGEGHCPDIRRVWFDAARDNARIDFSDDRHLCIALQWGFSDRQRAAVAELIWDIWRRLVREHQEALRRRELEEHYLSVVELSLEPLISGRRLDLDLHRAEVERSFRLPQTFLLGNPTVDRRPGAVNWVSDEYLAPLSATAMAEMQERICRTHQIAAAQLFNEGNAGRSPVFFDPEAADKAERLLREWLSPEQLAQYDADKSFDVIGCDTGKRYRIRHGTTINIDELDGKGRVACSLCFVPEGYLEAGDVMLAQKIALETRESEALAVANRFPGGAETFPVGTFAGLGQWLMGDWRT